MAKPIRSFKSKGFDVSVWATRNGGCSMTLSKRYKTKDTNEWKETKSYFPNEIPIIVGLLEEAKAWVHQEFGEPEPVPSHDTRPVHPAVQEVVDKIRKGFPGSVTEVSADDDDIPF